jgi:hypothetical protein
MSNVFYLKSSIDAEIDTKNLIFAKTHYDKVFLDSTSEKPYKINKTIILDRSGQTITGINPWTTCIEWCGSEKNSNVFSITISNIILSR